MDLEHLSVHLGQRCQDATTAAKVWACREAVIKAEHQSYLTDKVYFVLDKNCAPRIVDEYLVLKGPYMLSLSHEGDYVTAVALRTGNYA